MAFQELIWRAVVVVLLCSFCGGAVLYVAFPGGFRAGFASAGPAAGSIQLSPLAAGLALSAAVANEAMMALLAAFALGIGLYVLLQKRKKTAPPAVQQMVEAQEEEAPGSGAAYIQAAVTLRDGTQIGYMARGKGPRTLLFLHGLGSNYKGWIKLAGALADHYRCIAMDFPGYGASSKGEFPVSMAFFAGKVIEVAESLQLTNLTLVGHSMGGQVAMSCVLKRPRLFEKLVLIAPAGFESFNHTGHQWLRNLYNPTLLLDAPEEQVRAGFEANFYQFPDDARFMVDERLAMRQVPEAFSYYCRLIPRCVTAMLDEPVLPQLSRIGVPTLILFGQNDQLIPNKIVNPTLTTRLVGEIGAAQIPGSQLTMLSNCGHFAQWECAETIAGEIREFVG